MCSKDELATGAHIPAVKAACASATNDARSRPRTLASTAMRRLTRSRLIWVGPSSTRTLASWVSGIMRRGPPLALPAARRSAGFRPRPGLDAPPGRSGRPSPRLTASAACSRARGQAVEEFSQGAFASSASSERGWRSPAVSSRGTRTTSSDSSFSTWRRGIPDHRAGCDVIRTSPSRRGSSSRPPRAASSESTLSRIRSQPGFSRSQSAAPTPRLGLGRRPPAAVS